MAAAVTYEFYSQTYGGGLSESAFGLALPAASRHVRWLVGGREPSEDEIESYQRPVPRDRKGRRATRAMTAQTRPSPARARRLTRARARLPSTSRWAARRLPGRSHSPSTTSKARLVRPGRKDRRGRREPRLICLPMPPSSTWATPSPRSLTSKRRSSDGRRHRFHEHTH